MILACCYFFQFYQNCSRFIRFWSNYWNIKAVKVQIFNSCKIFLRVNGYLSNSPWANELEQRGGQQAVAKSKFLEHLVSCSLTLLSSQSFFGKFYNPAASFFGTKVKSLKVRIDTNVTLLNDSLSQGRKNLEL